MEKIADIEYYQCISNNLETFWELFYSVKS